ncbi:5902_t:CDS:2, partial [Racocetra persica]
MTCSTCKTTRIAANFYHISGGKLCLHATCNQLVQDGNTFTNPSINKDPENMDLFSEITSKIFEEKETLNEAVNFAYEIEIDQDLLVTASLTQSDLVHNNDLKTIEDNFRKLAHMLIVPLELGSGYYWEVRNIHLNTWKKSFSGSATIYLGYTMREDRAWKRSDNQPPQRISEIRAPIERYNCVGNIKLTIIPKEQYILVKGHHNMAHKKPTYRQVKFPVEAKEWIRNNILFNIRCTEMHRRLHISNLINPEIHTLEQPKFIEKGFKILNYLENNFVRTLGFLTPLFKQIGVENATEIVIDSTFKTNQERFELFVVNLNCGGYGMPIAYLYLSTLDGTEEARNNPANIIKTRVEVLRMFFISLRQEGLYPKPVINPINNPWTRLCAINVIDNPIEVRFNSSNLQNELITNHNLMEERREKYTYYKKKFNIALELYNKEMDNNNFVNKFDELMKPLLKEIEECEKTLKAHKQQSTWQSKGKLA